MTLDYGKRTPIFDSDKLDEIDAKLRGQPLVSKLPQLLPVCVWCHGRGRVWSQVFLKYQPCKCRKV
jgi:hypothetical protein